MTQTILFLLISAFIIVTLAVLLVQSIIYIIGLIRKNPRSNQRMRLKRTALVLLVLTVVNIGFAAFSQASAFTPVILDENQNILDGSIAELIRVELNGRKQWITLRGWDSEKPILLFLAGGPGGSQLAAVRHELQELEKLFVVVGWDQPGSAKSYYADKITNLGVETYIQDGHELTEYLLERFSQDKIYLIGESWGSALGVFLIDRYPEQYHAFIGTGQMVDFAETERLDYKLAMEIANERSETYLVKKLQKNGMPPYYGKDVTLKSAVYLNYLSSYMTDNPEIHNSGYDTIRDITSPEYGLIDKINFIRGVLNTYNHVYQQLYSINLAVDYKIGRASCRETV